MRGTPRHPEPGSVGRAGGQRGSRRRAFGLAGSAGGQRGSRRRAAWPAPVGSVAGAGEQRGWRRRAAWVPLAGLRAGKRLLGPARAAAPPRGPAAQASRRSSMTNAKPSTTATNNTITPNPLHAGKV